MKTAGARPYRSGYYWFVPVDMPPMPGEPTCIVKVEVREDTGSIYILMPGCGHAIPYVQFPAGRWDGPLAYGAE